MSVEQSYSSWHPAFRPNSTAEVAVAREKLPAPPAGLADGSPHEDLYTTDNEFAFHHIWHPAFMPNSATHVVSDSARRLRGDTPEEKTPVSTTAIAEASPREDTHIVENEFAFHHVWHPAFMLNSTAPLASSSTGRSIDETHVSESQVLAAYNYEGDLDTDPEVKIGQADVLEHPRTPNSPTNDVNTDLENLRGALTTALASPGGIEMDENPVHSGPVAEEEASSELAETGEMAKSEFPSEGPTDNFRQTKSSAAAAFVPHNMDWEEDDDVDPEWNFKASESNPFQSMPKSKRTNSFPAIPPVHLRNSTSSGQVLAKSQAEDIMNKMELPLQSVFSDDDNEENFLADVGSSEIQRSLLEDTEAYDQRGWNDELGKSYGGDAAQDLEFESRFEEGLPLIADAEPRAAAPNEVSKPTSQFFSDDEYDEGDSFFAGGGNSSIAGMRSTTNFGRKSSMQVLESIHFPPHENTYPESPELPKISIVKPGTDNFLSEAFLADEILSPDDDVISVAKAREPSEDDLAERWKAALDGEEFLADEELLADDPVSPLKTAVDPAAFFGSDDEGFLEDNDEFDLTTGKTVSEQKATSSEPFDSNGEVTEPDKGTKSDGQRNRADSQNRYLPAGAAQSLAQPPPSNPYSPTGLLLTDLSSPAVQNPNHSYEWNRAGPAAIPPASVYGAPQAPRPEVPKAQSFADKGKGGYASPYDLPMEVVKPRKRQNTQQTSQGFNNSTPVGEPPPRSGSFNQDRPLSRPSTSSLSPPTTSQSNRPLVETNQASQSLPHLPPTLKAKPSFFEDLPIASKAKPAVRHSSKPGSPTVPLSPSHNYSPPVQASSGPSVPQTTAPGLRDVNHGLVAPPQVSPFAPLPNGQSTIAPPTSRYSPAPSQVQAQIAPPPVPQGRYAAVPTLQRQPGSTQMGGLPKSKTPPFSHQPRTSSPLAHFERSQDRSSYSSQPSALPGTTDRRGSSNHEFVARAPNLPPTPETDEQVSERPQDLRQDSLYHTQDHAAFAQQQINRGAYIPKVSNIAQSKRASSNYVSEFQTQPPVHDPAFVPPRRSQTQSPGSAAHGPGMEMAEPYQRPISVHGPTSPSRPNVSYSAAAPRTRARGFSQGLNYIAPADGREHDPLQRWRGCPVFAWGVGGTIITSFPKEVPRYGVGQALPMIQSSPGEIKVRNIKDIYPLEERLSSFPGPLKGKSKKKEAVAWLSAGIDILERQNSYLRSLNVLTHEDKRKEERVLLWKLLRVMIEHDGILEGNPSVNASVRDVLSPGIDMESSNATPQYATGADLTGIYRARGAITQADPVDPAAVDTLRKHLLRGDRERAVWEAVDKRLWAHALLISNTLSRELYKQVAQEFVLKEVKAIGENTESLAALYEIFAGNFEESVDELVPPSARAGFQMMSTSSGTGPSKNAIDGLDRWRETLGLVLSNRSPDDNQAINALGKLLSGYGRAEAAHICFLFARTHSVFGGVDDPNSNIVLLGSDHQRQLYEFDRELEPILLSEIYEYGFSLSSTSNIPVSSAHLAVYKLQHATILAEFGQRDKALQYCEAIGASITSQTRRSPYHHALLIEALEDLSKRLKQSPKDESSSWISKPSIDKVSGSVWAKFNKFVAGEENDAGSATSGDVGAEAGPFARIAGGTPTISRSPSNADIYGSHGALVGSGAISIPTGQRTTSRYAPGGSYTPPVSHDVVAPSSYGSQRSFGQSGHLENTMRQEKDQNPRVGSLSRPSAPAAILQSTYMPQGQEGYPVASYNSYASVEKSLGGTYTPPNGPGLPVSNIHDYYPASGNEGSPRGYSPNHSSYDPNTSNSYNQPRGNGVKISAPYNHQQPRSDGYDVQAADSYIPPTSGYESPISASYDPPTNSGYQAPSYGGYEPPVGNNYEPPTGSGYEPQTDSGYEPPIDSSEFGREPSSGYEPPAYEPPPMSDEPDSDVDTRPKKKSIPDDDDDDEPRHQRAENNKVEKTKAEKDREAEEAFRRAAEADAKKDTSQTAKKGWGLGGWFGGKKDGPIDMAAPNKPIKAKLGEASSFYYDPDLKRWVNKKASKDDPSTIRSETPPPPRSAPRAASGPPTIAPPSASNTPPPRPASATLLKAFDRPGVPSLAVPQPMSRSASNGSAGGPPTAPPSRPATSMSNASSIDDLLGPPAARKAGSKKAKKGRGYVDVMGDKGGAL